MKDVVSAAVWFIIVTVLSAVSVWIIIDMDHAITSSMTDVATQSPRTHFLMWFGNPILFAISAFNVWFTFRDLRDEVRDYRTKRTASTSS